LTRKRFAKKKQQEKTTKKKCCGANKEAKDKNNKTPLHIADKNDQIKRGNKKNDIIHLYNNKLNISDALQIIRERMGVHMQRKKEKRKS